MSFLNMIFGFDHTTAGVPTACTNSAAAIYGITEFAERHPER
ncbi:hypothetical protein [Bifidobacterium sp. AGR2158]|nr:hypothetical protein [Bifidobacterium sp. AGR2158]